MTVLTRTRPTEAVAFKMNRVHRLLIYVAATIWFMAYTLAQQRNYQDAWILTDIFVPFVVCAGLYLWVVANETDNRVVAVVTAWTVFLVEAIPALKYKQPYGTALDATIHYEVIKSLMTTGHSIAQDEVYSSIPAIHAWMASMALAGGFTAESAVKFGLPLSAGLMPLLVYWFSRVVKVAAGPAKYSIVLTIPAAFTQFTPSGTGFTMVPLVFLLGVLLLREFYDRRTSRLVFSVIVLVCVAQLTVWHSTTPMVLPLILMAASLTPILARLANRRVGRLRLAWSFVWVAVLVAVAFLAYHILNEDQMFRVVSTTASKFFSHQQAAQTVVPTRIFQITALDLLRVALLIQGNDGLLIALTGIGALVVWHYRSVWRSLLLFYAFWLLVAGVFLSMMGLAITGLDYARFLTVPVGLAPFLGGAGLWWLHQRLTRQSWSMRWIGLGVWGGLVLVLAAVWVMEFYGFQPFVPRAKSLDPSAPQEYVVWLDSVNTAYQQRMLTFAQQNADPQSHFAVDITSHRQFLRYFGTQAGNDRRLYQPLQMQEAVDPTKVDFFLLHWPGVSGSFAEQVEWRSTAKIRQLYQTPGWDVVYDNGQSFILKVH